MNSLIKKIDWQMIISVFVLIGAGLLSLLSSKPDLFYKQIVWVVIGGAFGLFFTMVDLRSFFSHKSVIRWLFLTIVFVLIGTFIFAPSIKGNRSWIVFGSFQFQPSEFAKIVLIITLSYFFSRAHVKIAYWKTIVSSFLISAILGFLVAILPDMGSALVLFAIWFGFVLVSGIPLKRFVILGLVFILGFFLLWTLVLKPYQKERIIGIFFPEKDPTGVNYQVIQSKIAIGSGGFFGKGFGQGTQVQLGFLPEAQTDFIFAAIVEEGGLFVSLILLGAFGFLITRILKVGSLIDGNFNKFFCLGTSILFLSQFILNVGSNIGLLPVVGVTLPFVSYGGSSIFTNLVLIGIIQSIWVRRI
jgi:rod shape determining protein RodA